MLEAKREDVHVEELLLGELGEGRAEARTQGGGTHVACVDDEVGHRARVLELPALALDGVLDGLAGDRERVAAAVLVVAAHENLVGGVQEEELAGELVLAELADGVRELVEEALAAQVAGHGQVAAHARVDSHELRELRDKARREVVDAEVAHVLEAVQGLRAARAGHARDDHDVGDAVAALGVAHVLAGACVWHSPLLRSGGNRIKYRGWCPAGALVLVPLLPRGPCLSAGGRGDRPTIETLA